MKTGGKMNWTPILLALAFLTAIVGIVAYITREDNMATDLRGDMLLNQEAISKQLTELTKKLGEWKLETDIKTNDALATAKDAKRITIEIKDQMQAIETKASAASDMAHQALMKASRPAKIEVSGSVYLMRPPKEKIPPLKPATRSVP